MMRRLFLMTVAALAGLAVAGEGQAAFVGAPGGTGFEVHVFVDNVEYVPGASSDTTAPYALLGKDFTVDLGGGETLSISYSASTNLPGGVRESFVFDTTGLVTNNSTSFHSIRIEATAQPFTLPAVGGDTLYYRTTATVVDGPYDLNDPVGGSTNSTAVSDLDVYTVLNNDISTRTADEQWGLNPKTGRWESPLLSFIRGSSFALTNVVEFNVDAGVTSQVSTKSAVTTPAPAGLVLAATAVPFFGLLRRRMRKAEVAA